MANTLPELYKGLTKGVMWSLSLQNDMVVVHFFTNQILNLSVQYYLVAVLEWRLVGIWVAKLAQDWAIIILLSLDIEWRDWNQVAMGIRDFQKKIEQDIERKEDQE